MKLEDLCDVKNNAGIYYLYDTINKKYFIGQSIRIKNKFEKLFSIKNPTTPIEIAINTVGIDNFEFNIIKYLDEDNYAVLNKKLNELENLYINEYNSKLPNGYNPIVFNAKVQKVEDNAPFEIKECYYYINVSTGYSYISSNDNINYIILDKNECKEQYIQVSKEAYINYKEGLQQVIQTYVQKFIK